MSNLKDSAYSYAGSLGGAAFAVALDGEAKRFYDNQQRKKDQKAQAAAESQRAANKTAALESDSASVLSSSTLGKTSK